MHCNWYLTALVKPFLGSQIISGRAGSCQQLDLGWHALQGILHGEWHRSHGSGAFQTWGTFHDPVLRSEGDRVQLHFHDGRSQPNSIGELGGISQQVRHCFLIVSNHFLDMARWMISYLLSLAPWPACASPALQKSQFAVISDMHVRHWLRYRKDTEP